MMAIITVRLAKQEQKGISSPTPEQTLTLLWTFADWTWLC